MKIKSTLIFMILLVVLVGGVSAAEISDNADAGNDTVTNEISEDLHSDNVLEMSNDEKVLGDGEGTFSQLDSIIEGNETGSTIYLDNDYVSSGYSHDGIAINKQITIDGQGRTLDSQGNSRIFFVNASGVVLKNIIFLNGNSSQGGAICFNNTQTAVLENCTFINAASENGAVSFTGGNLTIENCEFVNCSYISSPYVITDSETGDSRIVLNSTVSILYVNSTGNVIISKSKFRESKFLEYGVNIEHAGSVTLTDNEFNGNLNYCEEYERNITTDEPYVVGYSLGTFPTYPNALLCINANEVKLSDTKFEKSNGGTSAYIMADNLTVDGFEVRDSNVESAFVGYVNNFTSISDVSVENFTSTIYYYSLNQTSGQYFLQRASNYGCQLISIFSNHDENSIQCIELKNVNINGGKDIYGGLMMIDGNNLVVDNVNVTNVYGNLHEINWDGYDYEENYNGPSSIKLFEVKSKNLNLSNVNVDNVRSDEFMMMSAESRGNVSVDDVSVRDVEIGDPASLIYISKYDSLNSTIDITNVLMDSVKADGVTMSNENQYSIQNGAMPIVVIGYNSDVTISDVSINNSDISSVIQIDMANNVDISDVLAHNSSMINSQGSIHVDANANITLSGIDIDNLIIKENIEIIKEEDGSISYGLISIEMSEIGIYVKSQNGGVSLRNIGIFNSESAVEADGLIYAYAANGNLIAENISLENISVKDKVSGSYDPGLGMWMYSNTSGDAPNNLLFESTGNIILSNLNVYNVSSGTESEVFLAVRAGKNVTANNISIVDSCIDGCEEGGAVWISADNVVLSNLVVDSISKLGKNTTHYEYFKYIYDYEYNPYGGFAINILADNAAAVNDISLTNIANGGGPQGILYVGSKDIFADNILIENVTVANSTTINYDSGLLKYTYTMHTPEQTINGLTFMGEGTVNITNIKADNTISSSGSHCYFYASGENITLENMSLSNSKISGDEGASINIYASNNADIRNIILDNLSNGLVYNSTEYSKEAGKYIWETRESIPYGFVGLDVSAKNNLTADNITISNTRDMTYEFLMVVAANTTISNVNLENVSQSPHVKYTYDYILGTYTYEIPEIEGSIIMISGSENLNVTNVSLVNATVCGDEGCIELSGGNAYVENFSIVDSAISGSEGGGVSIDASGNVTVSNFFADNVSPAPGENSTSYESEYGKYTYEYSSSYGGFSLFVQGGYVLASNIALTNIVGGSESGIFSIESQNIDVDNVFIENITSFDHIEIEYVSEIGEHVVISNYSSYAGGGISLRGYEGVVKASNIVLNNAYSSGEESPVLIVYSDLAILENISLSNVSLVPCHYITYDKDRNEYFKQISYMFDESFEIDGNKLVNITNMLIDNVPCCYDSLKVSGENITIDNLTVKNMVQCGGEYSTDYNTHELVLTDYSNIADVLYFRAGNYLLISNSNFENITFGASQEEGSLLFIYTENYTLDNCTFKDINSQDPYRYMYYSDPQEFTEEGYGALVRYESALANIMNSRFINCSSTYGGAIYAVMPLNITGSEFINCSAKFGGAIYIEGEGLFINNTNFTQNRAVDGGALYFTNQSVNNTVYGAFFLKNLAENNGGALYILESTENGTNIINASVFYLNHADYNGGAFFFNDTINRIVWEDYRWHNATASSKIHDDLTFVSKPLERTMIIFSEFEDNSDYALNITAHNNAIGGNHTVTISINEAATGYVYVNITDMNGNFIKDKQGNEIKGYYPLENGSVLLELEDLLIGDYIVSANYSDWEYGHILYYHVNSTVFTVYPHDLNVTANRTVFADENVTVVAKLNNMTTGTVNITISNSTMNLTFTDIPVINGTAEFNYTGLWAGDYNATVTYNGDDIFYTKSNSTLFTVLQRDSKVSVSVSDNVYGSTAKIIVEVPQNQTGNVTVKINNQTFTKEVTNGTVIFEVDNLTAGEWEADVTFEENRIYKSNTTIFKFDVSKANLTAEVIGNNVTVKDNASFAINVPEDFNGNVTIEIEGKTYYDGPVSDLINITSFPAGNYTANAEFYGDNNYNDTKVEAPFNVAAVEPEITAVIANVTYGENATATVNVSGNANGTVNITVDGKTYTGTVSNGTATLQLDNLTAGDKVADIRFITSDRYNLNATATASFTVAKCNSTVMISSDNLTAIVKVSDNATGNVTVYVNGVKYTREIVGGEVIIEDVLVAGDNSIVAVYHGDENFLGSENSTKIILPLKIIVTDLLADEKRVIINITGRSTGNVTVIVDNGQRSITKNLTGGSAVFDLTGLSREIHNVTVIGPDGTVEEIELDGRINATIKIVSIKSEDMIRGYNSPYDYQAVFLDKYGEELANITVTFRVNGKEYNVKTDDEGIAQLTGSKLAVGRYNITSINPVTGEEAVNELEIVKRITENKDLTMDFSDGSKFVVKVWGDDGNIAPEGEIIDINVNGIHYVCKVDKKGYATLKINLGPKKYKITAEYKGFKTTNKLNVKHILKAVKKTVTVKKGKKITIKAKLKWSSGKAIKGKKITFKFKGKTYKAKTNKKGIAKVVIKNKKVLKKLKKGKKYPVKITYAVKVKYGMEKVTVKDTAKCKVKIKK